MVRRRALAAVAPAEQEGGGGEGVYDASAGRAAAGDWDAHGGRERMSDDVQEPHPGMCFSDMIAKMRCFCVAGSPS